MDLNLLQPLLKKQVENYGYDLYEMKLKKDKENNILSLVVDRAKPINMEDIVFLSNELNYFLDNLDLLKDEKSYVLDVCSLGAEKPLKKENLNDYVNEYVNVHLLNPVEGENIYEGFMNEVNDDDIVISFKIKTRQKKIKLSKNNISKIRLAIKF